MLEIELTEWLLWHVCIARHCRYHEYQLVDESSTDSRQDFHGTVNALYARDTEAAVLSRQFRLVT